jgi:hypothetical protein
MDTLREVALVGPGISAIVAALAFVVGVLTLAKAIVEYVRQNALKRLEKFQEMKRKAETAEGFSKLCILLLEDDPEILKVERNVKEAFLSFYEEIALIHNSRLISTPVAHYMFGYYAIRCYDNQNFLERHG